ncbi:sugar phosphate isomerase/epimerase family protein [Pedobacter sandarakinus]|uniref:sugar phosphate isomerase/epimerase family protein n=1 Tax=Pedobacter sandarakinus TaxID=353156 RepID=UPI002245B55E|nr:sugar phosphate isomerase/epimerase family protein [Pedobacter sandarakinus]MCX2575408.1 sugar phosphate isomerase/epimerase [Pedobacter sandarakinus]
MSDGYILLKATHAQNSRLKVVVGLLFFVPLFLSFQLPQRNFLALGIVAPMEKDSLVAAVGFRMFGETVGKTIAPALTEEAFQRKLVELKASKAKLYMCNIMFSGDMKIAGPDVNEDRVLRYSDVLLRRAQQANVKVVVLGSGGARRLPENYDVKQATQNFVALAKKISTLASKYNVKIALENLQRKETNFLNTLKETAAIVRLVNHPNFGLNADIFHMTRENESPQNIVDAKDVLIHCEIAENEERTLPGIKGDDFTPYLAALKKANYKGPIFIEAASNYTPAQLAYAFKFLNQQIDAVYRNR